MRGENYSSSVFINCPFDSAYHVLERAIVFCVIACGFVARSAKEYTDSSEVRIQKIRRIIGECKFGIHDISRTELDDENQLPRFNMPLELGLFLGAKWFGDKKQRRKNCLILDIERYRFQKFISDIAGQDIKEHSNNPEKAIKEVRNWLQGVSKREMVGGAKYVSERYSIFREDLPQICVRLRLDYEDLTFKEYVDIVNIWLRQESRELISS